MLKAFFPYRLNFQCSSREVFSHSFFSSFLMNQSFPFPENFWDLPFFFHNILKYQQPSQCECVSSLVLAPSGTISHKNYILPLWKCSSIFDQSLLTVLYSFSEFPIIFLSCFFLFSTKFSIYDVVSYILVTFYIFYLYLYFIVFFFFLF